MISTRSLHLPLLQAISTIPSRFAVEKKKENNGCCKAFCVTHKDNNENKKTTFPKVLHKHF